MTAGSCFFPLTIIFPLTKNYFVKLIHQNRVFVTETIFYINTNSFFLLNIFNFKKSSWAKPVHPSQTVVRRCSVKKVFLKIVQNSQGNTCARVSGLRPATLFKKRLWHRCFPMNFAKFLRTPFFIERVWWLLPRGSPCQTSMMELLYGNRYLSPSKILNLKYEVYIGLISPINRF